jgi:large subunit ribosomal protein L7e
MSDYVLISTCRTVPTQNDVLVPETLLKKRKSQEKARAERTAEQDKQKKVGSFLPFILPRTT